MHASDVYVAVFLNLSMILCLENVFCLAISKKSKDCMNIICLYRNSYSYLCSNSPASCLPCERSLQHINNIDLWH
jgi:hypothetical protein